MSVACGVDFGTSNSTVGWSRPNQSALLPLEEGKVTLPSVIFFNADEDTFCYGRAALAEYLAGYEGRLMRSLKSLLGSSLIDGQTEVNGRALPFRQLLTYFIGELKHRAEKAVEQSLSYAVLGRPVFFVDGNPDGDQRAEDTLAAIAHAVGFKEITFQYEPIAAAFDYESSINSEELVLIVDIGGGTSDFSVVRLSPERAKQVDRKPDILASGGVHIGGTDFDKYLSLSSVMPLLGMGSTLKNNLEMPSSYYFNLATWHSINLLYTQKTHYELKDFYIQAKERDKLSRLIRLVEERAGHWLALQVESCKIELSEAQHAHLNLERIAHDQLLSISRDTFHTSISHLISKIETTITNLLHDANVAPDRINTVFFTGGASGVHLLRERVAALLPTAKRVDGDLFGSIGAGLALDAVRKFG
ncbi:MAG: Hsp70 family protein [Pseudomonadota bacterium]